MSNFDDLILSLTQRFQPHPPPPSRPPRQHPSSIPESSDLCRKWTLWHRGDHLDSLLCCKLFPTQHTLSDSDIAGALATLHAPCANMVAQDVAELWGFLREHPDLHTNGYRYWEGIRIRAGMTMMGEESERGKGVMVVKRGDGEREEGGEWSGKGKEKEKEKEKGKEKEEGWMGMDRDDEAKVGMAIGRFRNAVPGGSRRRGNAAVPGGGEK